MKKVLILNGSPKPEGRTASMLQKLYSGIQYLTDCQYYNVYELNITSCKGCMQCQTLGKCVLPEDDAHRLGIQMASADIIVLGTPVYLRNMSSGLKKLLERNIPIIMDSMAGKIPKPKMQGKKLIYMVSGNTPEPWNWILPETRGALNSVKNAFHYSGAETMASIASCGSQKSELSKKTKRQIEKLSKNILDLTRA
ncbi:MAG: flavodoxin family protein [Bacteroidales bacterium]|nr:flavodoxin family protein [Bacteroidales bacterium]